MINMWRRPHLVRRFITERVSEKIILTMNVQPAKNDNHFTEDKGDRVVKKLTSISDKEVMTADEHSGRLSDRLLYKGLWYECLSANDWTHTPLSHWEGEWVLMPPSEQDAYE